MDKLNIKAIVCDLDDTLLNDKKEITKRTKEVLIKVQNQGIKLILASGRQLKAMIEYAMELEMNHHHGFLIGFNGACVSDVQDFTFLYEHPIPHEKTVRLLDYLNDFDVTPLVVKNDELHIAKKNKFIFKIDEVKNFNVVEHEVKYEYFTLIQHDDLKDSLTGTVHKVLATMDYNVLRDQVAALTIPFEKELQAVVTFACYLEYTNRGVDKAYSLNMILKDLDIRPDEVMVFGDSYNDLTMLQLSKYSVAMENAVQEVRDIAWRITGNNNEDGIADIVEKYVLKT